MPRVKSKKRVPVTAQALPNIPTSFVKPSTNSILHNALAVPEGIETTSTTSSQLAVHSTKSVTRQKSSMATAQLIRRYHTLNKELSKCLSRVEKQQMHQQQLIDSEARPGTRHSQHMRYPASNAESKGEVESVGTGAVAVDLKRIAEIRQEMDDLGGLDMYQKASTLGQSKQRGGDSSKWLVPIISRTRTDRNKSDPPLRLLDIGALSPENYQKQSSWIHTTPIDLNPQHPAITKMDFLEMPVPSPPASPLFDIVCLSLVVNFVGDPAQRGEILRHSSRFLVPGKGILYLVLPLPCIDNSRYMDHGLLVEMMASVGYGKLLDHHFAKKVAYYAFQLNEDYVDSKNVGGGATGPKKKKFPKKMLHDKPNRNK